MHRLLIIALVVVLSSTAYAGGNPNARVYIDFDPPNYVHAIAAPAPYTFVDAYLCVDNLGTGMTVISFRLTDLAQEYPGMCAPPAFYDLFSDSLPIYWNPFESPGYTAANASCQSSASGSIVLGRVSIFYLGGAGCLAILDHDDYPRWIVDCDDGVDYFCVYMNGSIGGASCPDGDCEQVPVEPGTWGLVKALYR